MKKLNKTIVNATAYQTWQQSFIDEEKDFTKYNSSNGKFYYDIVAELLINQNGLCAYTEEVLCDIEEIKNLVWKDGKLSSDFPKLEIAGHLDHFDATLKDKKGWLWDNFFFINEKVNVKTKSDKSVFYILKPDSESYDPFKYLSYNEKTHKFSPNIKLEEEEKKQVKYMIEIFGLNTNPLKKKRMKAIKTIQLLVKIEETTWDNLEIDEFPTAIEMIKRKRA